MWCTGMCFRKSIKNCFGAHSRTEEEESKSPKLAFTIERKSFWELWQFTLHSSSDVYWPTQEAKKVTKVKLPSISSTINKQIFRTNVVFSSYVWLGAKNLYEKHARKTLMKLTPGLQILENKSGYFISVLEVFKQAQSTKSYVMSKGKEDTLYYYKC